MSAGRDSFPVAWYPPTNINSVSGIAFDFIDNSEYDTTATIGIWTSTETGSGTQAVGNTVNGELVLTNAAADDDVNTISLQNESFAPTEGKRLRFDTRLKVSDADQSDLICGLIIGTATTPVASAPSDGIYFRSDDGDANIDIVTVKNSTATTSAAVGTLADDTYIRLSFEFDGDATNGEIIFFVNDSRVGSLAVTNLPDDEVLTVMFSHQNGEAVAKVLTIDYVQCYQDRNA